MVRVLPQQSREYPTSRLTAAQGDKRPWQITVTLTVGKLRLAAINDRRLKVTVVDVECSLDRARIPQTNKDAAVSGANSKQDRQRSGLSISKAGC